MDGVYDCDPMKFPDAKLHRALTYAEVRAGNLAVMDETAITLCKVRPTLSPPPPGGVGRMRCFLLTCACSGAF